MVLVVGLLGALELMLFLGHLGRLGILRDEGHFLAHLASWWILHLFGAFDGICWAVAVALV